jgi:Zn-dependent protease with chaperone function
MVNRQADRLAAVLAPQPAAMADELLAIVSGGER